MSNSDIDRVETVEAEPAAPDTVKDTPNIVDNVGDDNKANNVPDAATVDDLASEHVADMPAGFDPTIHAVDRDGRPIVKSNGEFAKKRGRRKGAKATSGAVFSALPNPNAASTENAPLIGDVPSEQVDNGPIAKWSANLVFNAGVLFFGADLGEPTKDEKTMLPAAFKDYYDLKGAPNLPPEVGLFLAVGAYVAPRLMHERMTEKRRGIKAWFARFFRKTDAEANGGKNEEVSTGAATVDATLRWAR